MTTKTLTETEPETAEKRNLEQDLQEYLEKRKDIATALEVMKRSQQVKIKRLPAFHRTKVRTLTY